MNKKRLAMNLFGQLSAFAFSLGISFFLTPYIVGQLGEESYGFVGLANNVTNYITLFTVAINGMLSRYITIEYSKKDYEMASGYLSTVIITQIILALILFVPMMFLAGNMEMFFNVSAEILNDVHILWILIFLAFLVSLSSGGLSSATFATNRLDIQSVVNMVTNALRTIILITVFVLFPPHVWYVGLATILANIVKIILNTWSKKRLMPEVKISYKYFDRKYIHNLVVVGVWNSLNKLQQILYSGLDLAITNIFINGSEMGFLSIAQSIPAQISSLINTIAGTFDPTMTIAYGKGNLDEFLRQTKFSMKFTGFLCSVPILGFVAFGKNFYQLWLPSLVDAEIMKIQLLSVLILMPQIFSVYIYPLYTVNTITAKLKIPVLVSIGIGVLNVIFVIILLRTTSLGVYAVAGVSSFLWLFRIFLFVPMYASWSLKLKWCTFYSSLLKGVLNNLLIGSFLLAVSRYLIASSWVGLLVLCATFGIIGYLLSFFIIFDKQEQKKAILILKRNFIKR